MSNIFNIQNDLIAIFNEIEENDGELTPKLEEQLNITQEEFREKIKSYSGIIKMLENDINEIKAERDRLYNLQKSKDKAINRLKKIIIEAVDKFGDTTKAGGKYVDYGIGKVSIRNTKAVEVEEDSINRFVNRFMVCLKWHSENNQLDSSLINPQDVIDYVNTKSPIEEDSNEEINKFTMKDIEYLDASIDFGINFKDLISTKKGIDLLRALLNYNVFDIKAKADKREIKESAASDNHFMPVYAKIVNNKSITIR